MTQIAEKVINGEAHTRDSIVDEHEGLVHSVCHKFTNWARNVGHDYDDIVSIGFIGLIKAFDYFDGEKFPVRFSTYAVPMIRGEIQKVLRSSGTGVHYSRGIKELAFDIQKNELDELSVDAIATELREDRKKIIHALNYLQHGIPSSLDQPIRELDSDSSISDLVGKPDDTTELQVKEFLEKLDEKERNIVEGLIDGRTQADIGRLLGVSQVQVSRTLKTIRSKYVTHFVKQDSKKNIVKEHIDTKDVREMATKKGSVEITEEIVSEMRDKGMSYAKIAKEFGVSATTISNHIQKWKVEKVRRKHQEKQKLNQSNKANSLTKRIDPKKTGAAPQVTPAHEKIDTLKKEMEKKDVVIQNQEEKIVYLKTELNKALEKVAEHTVITKDSQQDQKLLAILLERESNRMKSLLKSG